MKILNLYAGIGGNRKLWGDEHEITAVEIRKDIALIYKDYFPNDNVVIGDAHEYLINHYKEFDFIWSSPPCPTHSRARFWGLNANKYEAIYPDMKLYQEIIILQTHFKGMFLVENVTPYYEPLLPPTMKIGRHLFWSNFKLLKTETSEFKKDSIAYLEQLHGFSINIPDKQKVLRNCVEPSLGLHILNCALNKVEIKQQTLFS